MGSIIAAGAVWLIHMDRNAVVLMKPSNNLKLAVSIKFYEGAISISIKWFWGLQGGDKCLPTPQMKP